MATTIKLSKEQLLEFAKKMTTEVHSTRADVNRAEIDSSFDDLSDLDTELPGEHSPFDDEENLIQNDVTFDTYDGEYDADYDDFYDQAGIGGRWDEEESNDMHPFEDDYEFYAHNDREERLGGHERFEESADPTLEEQVIRQIVKKIVKENYYNLSPLPSAEPVKSNGNGVDGVIPMKKVVKKESRVDDAQPFGRAGGVQSQQAAKALAGTPSAESERIAAAKKRAAMKQAAGMQSLEEEMDQASYVEKVRELAKTVNNKALPREVRLAAKQAWNDLNASRPAPAAPKVLSKQVEPGDEWYGVDVYAGALNKNRGAD